MNKNLAIATLNGDDVILRGENVDAPKLFDIKKTRTRLLVQKGIENVLLRLEEIVFFYTESKIVFVVDQSGKKYLSGYTLAELEKKLNPLVFFRANRQYIINIDHIRSFRSFEKVKIRVDMDIPGFNPCIIISQETASTFRKWMHEA